MRFVHLHAHSAFTFLFGMPTPTQLVSTAKKKGQDRIAMTDCANVSGVVELFEAAEKEKVVPIIGSEIWTIDSDPKEGEIPGGYQIVALVESQKGWENLCALLSTAHRQKIYTPRIRLEQIREMREGLHFLSGNRYGILRDGNVAEERIRALVEATGGRLDLEYVDHGTEEDRERNERIVNFANSFSLPIVATNDVRYLEPLDAGVLESMVSVGAGPKLAREAVDSDQAYFKTAEEMKDIGCPIQWLERSAEIAENCNFSLIRGKPRLPKAESGATIQELIKRFPPPHEFPVPTEKEMVGDGPEINKYFRWMCKKGLELRIEKEPWVLDFGAREEYEQQMAFECDVIERMDYVVYHLIVSEFTNWSKDNGIAVGPGRGSAAGSIVVWALRITDINPKQFGLFFERFLNPERKGLPDIDMDFEQEDREKVIAHVREKYGDECVGQIMTIGRMKARGALKDAARICRVRFNEADSWASYVDNGPKAKLKDSLETGYLQNLKQGSPLFRRVAELAIRLEGKPRQQSVHAAGVIIASDPIQSICPMHEMDGGVVATGLDMEAAEKVGLVKFDFLGLSTLDVIKRAKKDIENKTGKPFETLDPKFDDPAVYDLLRKGDTAGVFQLESSGLTRLLIRLVPESFEHVIAILALYRPGPMKAGMVDSWIERRHAREEATSIHPLLDEVLSNTYGLLVYQEQILKAAQIMAGFSLGQADLLRRAMGKKKPEEMAKQRKDFVEGCKRTSGLDEKESGHVFDLIDKFSGYGFNKSHSAAYAAVTYATAKLKAYHPKEFMAATLTINMGNPDDIRKYNHALKARKIKLLPPDLNNGESRFTPEENGVRFGLGAIRGVGAAAMEKLMAMRPFRSVEDLAERSKVSKTVMESIIWSGAMDSIENDRFEAWWKFNRPKTKELPKRQSAGQMLLFSNKTVGEEKAERDLQQEIEAKPKRPTQDEISEKEVKSLGITIGKHPLERYNDVSKKISTHKLGELLQIQEGKISFTTTARVESVESDEDRRGDPICFVVLEDQEAAIKVVIKKNALRTSEGSLTQGSCVSIQGTCTSMGEDEPMIDIERIERLSDVRWRTSRVIQIEIEEKDAPKLKELASILSSEKKGTHEVQFRVRCGETETKLRKKGKINPTSDLVEEIERILGRSAVHVPLEKSHER